MPRLMCAAVAAVAAVLLALSPYAAMAQETDLETGFHLGRYATTAMNVAYELTYMQSLIEEVHPAAVTDEAVAAGDVSEEDVQMAQGALVYAIWRVQFFLDTMLEAAQSSDSFQHEALADLRQPTLDVMADLQAARDDFMETTDLPALAAFGDALKAGDFATRLLTLAEQAAQKAGASVMN
jgi:hypothetical protein